MAKKGSTKWDEVASAGENARAQLPAVAGRYFRDGRKLMKGSPSAEELHAFRLKTKRLRYTLELFRPCYSSTLEQRLEALKYIQTVLGEINDCAAAGRLATASLPAKSAHLAKVERFLNARATRLTAEFRQHWQEKFDAPGREDWWVSYLARGRARASR